MKSFTTKALALAVLGLIGSGTAMAVCPQIQATSASPGGGGAWSSQTVTSTAFLSATPGLNGTNCAVSIALAASPPSNAKGYVTDTSPANEPHYRARFYINTAGLTNATASNRQFRIFSALATTPPAGFGAEMVTVSFIGSSTAGQPAGVRFVIGDTATGGVIKSMLFPNTGGNYRIEFDLTQGSPGTFRYWVTDAATASSDATPDGTASVTNAGWSGVKQVNLGMFGTSTQFCANVAGQPLIIDEFDSRRQTFIGM